MDAGWRLDNSYASLPHTLYTHLNPTPVIAPEPRVFNHDLAISLGLSPDVLRGQEGNQVFAGNQLPEGSFPIAQAYAGHQFGYFTMLGDGRAILLGEQITPQEKRYDIQLKGSGETPYSRRGDGRAALGPMLREYIISEAMQGLGIPTTRSLAVVTTGETVYREKRLAGAVLTRVASSHIRVGTFQYISKWGSLEELQALADYTIQRHYPGVFDQEQRYFSFLKEVIKNQASLIAKWMLTGFIHGVMNTDNMAISGETIDYGPCAFMDTYDPTTVFSSIDAGGRYAYGNQPEIAAWNLTRLAETLLPLLNKNLDKAKTLANEALSDFSKQYQDRYMAGMRGKLGLFREEQKDEELIGDLLVIMKKYKADYTNTFRYLTLQKPEESALYEMEEFRSWLDCWQERLRRQKESKEEVYQRMTCCNPAVIPRNHRVEEALEAAVEHGDDSLMERLVKVLRDPYAYTIEQLEFTTLPEQNCKNYRTFCGT